MDILVRRLLVRESRARMPKLHGGEGTLAGDCCVHLRATVRAEAIVDLDRRAAGGAVDCCCLFECR